MKAWGKVKYSIKARVNAILTIDIKILVNGLCVGLKTKSILMLNHTSQIIMKMLYTLQMRCINGYLDRGMYVI